MEELLNYLRNLPVGELKELYGPKFGHAIVEGYKSLLADIENYHVDTIVITRDDRLLERDGKILQKLSDISAAIDRGVIESGYLTPEGAERIHNALIKTYRFGLIQMIENDPVVKRYLRIKSKTSDELVVKIDYSTPLSKD